MSRHREQTRIGYAMIAAALFLFSALIASAIYADAGAALNAAERGESV